MNPRPDSPGPTESDRSEPRLLAHWVIPGLILTAGMVVAVAVAYSLHPKRRTVWIGSAVALAIVALLTTMTLHLLVIAFRGRSIYVTSRPCAAADGRLTLELPPPHRPGSASVCLAEIGERGEPRILAVAEPLTWGST